MLTKRTKIIVTAGILFVSFCLGIVFGQETNQDSSGSVQLETWHALLVAAGALLRELVNGVIKIINLLKKTDHKCPSTTGGLENATDREDEKD